MAKQYPIIPAAISEQAGLLIVKDQHTSQQHYDQFMQPHKLAEFPKGEGEQWEYMPPKGYWSAYLPFQRRAAEEEIWPMSERAIAELEEGDHVTSTLYVLAVYSL